MASLTPMMQQYLQLKERYKDCLLFFRLGDFYEMFFDDAVLVSKELELTLTGRDCGMEERAPMCGVPYHAVDTYIARLVEKGYKVAICEQMEDPALAKGLVERDVIRIITPGTITDGSMLDEKENNYLLCAHVNGDNCGIAFVDISTGRCSITQLQTAGLADELARIQPAEMMANESFFDRSGMPKTVQQRLDIKPGHCSVEFDDADKAYAMLEANMSADVLDYVSKEEMPQAVCALASLISYLIETQKTALANIGGIEVYHIQQYMILDAATRRNLELCETMRSGSRKGTLMWVLDHTSTAMGGRMLKSWIEQPLLNINALNERQEAVEAMVNQPLWKDDIKEALSGIYDIERLMSKAVYGNINARDLIALKQSLNRLPRLKELALQGKAARLKTLGQRIDVMDDIYTLVDKAIADDPPLSVKDGNIIKDGYDQSVDELRDISHNGRQWISRLEQQERDRTGIKSLKVGYNKVFGYYIEVTKSYYDMVPADYIRKQTLANAERYITPELKEMENKILSASERLMALEYQIFVDIRDTVVGHIKRVQQTASAVAELDCLCSLADAAIENHYVRPVLNEGQRIVIQNGRHPVVEKVLPPHTFVPNDTLLDNGEDMVCIITGPNMAGKSTYMRQAALIVLMAQIGSFVPADMAEIGIVDRIFTRVGASDDLSTGQSTFMVEMTEVAHILHNATAKSLLILDEIGRGTSTFDGLSIAWAVIEYVADPGRLGAKTLFATHYHELTELEGRLAGVKNYYISVREHGDDVIFLRKIMRGGSGRSFGIQVARLAGLPQGVIDRAKEILDILNASDINKKSISGNILGVKDRPKLKLKQQMDIFSYKIDGIMAYIKGLDVNSMTPIEALNVLHDIQSQVLDIYDKKAGEAL